MSKCTFAGLEIRLGFQQYKNPKHTAKLTKSRLSSNGIDILKWPRQSPDLNQIENLWRELKLRIQCRNLQNLHEVKEFCHQEWNKY